MTALILTPEQCAGLLAAVDAAYVARGMPAYWRPLPIPIISGPQAGRMAVDVGPDALDMEMRDGLTLAELPDFAAIMEALGNPQPVEVAAGDLKKL